jgi:tryptophanyl-tRNA synthetase
MSEIVILTGDRPTGPMHIGHYVGTLASRLQYQQDQRYSQYVLVADIQALTDYYDNPSHVADNVFEVMCDYLAVGLDPSKTTFVLQSHVHELAVLAVYYLNLVSVSRLERNPTVKSEIQQKGYSDSVTAGFLCYPVSQAADITAFKATVVPVGEDQVPLIEQTNEIVRRFNRVYKTDCLLEAESVLGSVPRLPGIDGKQKASKSLKNAIFLGDDSTVIREKVFAMFTDPDHLRVGDPGKVEGNTVFAYLDAFCKDKEEVEALKQKYVRGGLGDMKIKSFLNDVLQEFLAPIRERRLEFASQKKDIMQFLYDGTRRARKTAAATLQEVENVIGVGKSFKILG